MSSSNNSKELPSRVILPVSPLVGGGNPEAATAIGNGLEERLVKSPDDNCDFLVLPPFGMPLTSMLVGPVHKGMSGSERISRGYTNNSESLRSSRPARVYSMLLALEFTAQYRMVVRKLIRDHKLNPNFELTILATQEHLLLGLSAIGTDNMSYGRNGSNSNPIIMLIPPDAYLKESAKLAVRSLAEKTDLHTQLLLWYQLASTKIDQPDKDNHQTIEHWHCPKLKEKLSNPTHTGFELVFKSSGSGVPQKILDKIFFAFETSGKSFIIHLPDRIIWRINQKSGVAEKRFDSKTAQPGNFDKMSYFLNSFGSQTEILVTPPNENVGLVMLLHSLGLAVSMIFLPVRGNNEKRNQKLAQELGMEQGSIWEDMFWQELGIMIASGKSGRSVDQRVIQALLGITPIHQVVGIR